MGNRKNLKARQRAQLRAEKERHRLHVQQLSSPDHPSGEVAPAADGHANAAKPEASNDATRAREAEDHGFCLYEADSSSLPACNNSIGASSVEGSSQSVMCSTEQCSDFSAGGLSDAKHLRATDSQSVTDEEKEAQKLADAEAEKDETDGKDGDDSTSSIDGTDATDAADANKPTKATKATKTTKTTKKTSTDAEEEKEAEAEVCDRCAHARHVFPSQVSKLFKNGVALTCVECLTASVLSGGNTGGGRSGGRKGKNKKRSKQGKNTTTSADSRMGWICLACGRFSCGREMKGHALSHATKNGKHQLALQPGTLQVWCYKCDRFLQVDPTHSRHSLLREAVSAVERAFHPVPTSAAGKGRRASRQSDPSPDLRSSSSSRRSSRSSEPSHLSNEAVHALLTTATRAVPMKGFRNLGNTCFFNSVLQNLVRITPLATYLLPPKSAVSFPSDEGRLTTVFRQFLAQVWCGNPTSIVSPSNLLDEITRVVPQFRGFRQQDSHELLRYLLDTIREEELLRLREQRKRAAATALQSQSNRRTRAQNAVPLTFLDHVFGGKLQSMITCHECEAVSVTTETFLDLSLQIPDRFLPRVAAPAGRGKQDKGRKQRYATRQPTTVSNNFSYLTMPAASSSSKKGAKGRKARRKAAELERLRLKQKEQAKQGKQQQVEKEAESGQVSCSSPTEQSSSSPAEERSSMHTEEGFGSPAESSSSAVSTVAAPTTAISEPSRCIDSGQVFSLRPDSSLLARVAKDGNNVQPKVPPVSGTLSSSVAALTTAKDEKPDDEKPDDEKPEKQKDEEEKKEETAVVAIQSTLAEGSSCSGPEQCNDGSTDGDNTSAEATTSSVHSATPEADEVQGHASPSLVSESGSDSPAELAIEELAEQLVASLPRQRVSEQSAAIESPAEESVAASSAPSHSTPESCPAAASALASPEGKAPKTKAIAEATSEVAGAADFGDPNERLDMRDRSLYNFVDSTLSVQTCMDSFTQAETLKDENAYKCPCCSIRAGRRKKGHEHFFYDEDAPQDDWEEHYEPVFSTATKQFLIAHLPLTLVLHVKRFYQGAYGHLRKIDSDLAFPRELDLTPFCLPELREALVDLDTVEKLLEQTSDHQRHSGSSSAAQQSENADAQSENHETKLTNEEIKSENSDTNSPSACICSENADSAQSDPPSAADSSPAPATACPPPTTDTTDAPASPPTSSSSTEWNPLPRTRQKALCAHYRLRGLVVHSGGMGGGHYVAYVRQPKKCTPTRETSSAEQSEAATENEKDEWLYISDTHVSAVPASRVRKAQAYLLFYERVDGELSMQNWKTEKALKRY